MSLIVSEIEDKIYSNFIDSLRSAKTKDVYDKALKHFMKFHNIKSYSLLLECQNIEEKIKQYIMNIRSRELSTSFMNIFLSAIKSFYEMNDIENIRWRDSWEKKHQSMKIGNTHMKKFLLCLMLLTLNRK